MRQRLIDDCLRLARKQTKFKNHPEYEYYLHWTFIIQDAKIVGFGRNRNSKAIYSRFGYTEISKIHSETDAYRKLKGILDHNRHFDCLNIRLNRQGQLRIAKPCNACLKFLFFVGCKKVISVTGFVP